MCFVAWFPENWDRMRVSDARWPRVSWIPLGMRSVVMYAMFQGVIAAWCRPYTRHVIWLYMYPWRVGSIGQLVVLVGGGGAQQRGKTAPVHENTLSLPAWCHMLGTCAVGPPPPSLMSLYLAARLLETSSSSAGDTTSSASSTNSI